ncbi:MAG: hypothetical protein WDM78_17795 [Puia sp.]
MILLKDLFTEGLTNKEGTIISNKVIQTIVEEVVEKEDKKKPYTDQQLADILSGKGYIVARQNHCEIQGPVKYSCGPDESIIQLVHFYQSHFELQI